jgi:galactitol-specific phosphotransferase system IIB component
MYSSDDILILGDSFCAWRDHTNDWPVILLSKLTGLPTTIGPRGQGYRGAGWWSVRQALLKELEIKTPKVLIMCHTSHSRLASDLDLPLSPARADPNVPYTWSNEIIEKVGGILELEATVKAITYYYGYLYSAEYHHWCQLQWFKELDSLVISNNIEKVIHLHVIPYKNDPIHCFTTGITNSEYLIDLVIKSGRVPGQVEDTSVIRNHFTISENKSIANTLYDVIINDNSSGVVKNLNLFGYVNGIS